VLTTLPGAVKSQQTALLTAYASALGKNNSSLKAPDSSAVSDYQTILTSLRNQKLFSDRVIRAIPVAILLALVITLLIQQRKNGSLTWIIGGLIFVLLFNLRYAILDKKVYSLSSIISQMNLIVYIATTTAVALVLAWLVINIYNKTFKGSASENGLKTLWLGLTVVFITGLPVLLSFLLNGPVVTWTLPDYLTSFLALIALIQILAVSALTPILAGITVLITKIGNIERK
jgi:cation transport ATPase